MYVFFFLKVILQYRKSHLFKEGEKERKKKKREW